MKQNFKPINILVELSRIVVGVTFVFSGFVKSVDPLGFTYKIQDYLVEMNLVDLYDFALPSAIFLVVAEFVLGALLLLGLYRKPVTILIALMMIFFTPFTLWIALTNPVENCGCFGDALVISNWQTFYKNLIIVSGAILLMLKWSLIKPLFKRRMVPFAAVFVVLFGLLFALHNVYNLPVIDFRPYKIGANIPQQMYIDPEKADVIETVFIYSKDGEDKEFTEDNYPWNDSTWTFVDMKTRVVVEGEKPAIEDFSIQSLYYDELESSWNIGGDITDMVLSDTTYTFLMVSYSLENINEKYLDKFRSVMQYAESNGYPFYLLTASSENVVGEWEANYKTGVQFCHADERALKTMIRANPGLILLKEGDVINKWDDSKVTVPNSEILQINNPQKDNEVKLLLIALLFFVPLLFMKKIDR